MTHVDSAMKKAEDMAKIERFIMMRRIAKLQSHFWALQQNLSKEEDLARIQRQQSMNATPAVQSFVRKVNASNATLQQVQATQTKLQTQEATLRDQVLAETQKRQQAIN